MDKKLFFIFAAALFFCAAAQASDPVRPYIGVKGGVSFVESEFGLGYYYRYYHYDYDGYNYNYYPSYSRDYDESNDTVFAGSVSLGVKALRAVRLEFEYTYRTQASHEYEYFPDIEQNFDTFMINAFYDHSVTRTFVPYFGIGLGMTHVSNKVIYNGYYKTASKGCFSAGFDLGVSFIVVKGLNFDCGFRGLYLGGMKLEDEDFYMYAGDFYLGLRYAL